jgi:hypothetical protein
MYCGSASTLDAGTTPSFGFSRLEYPSFSDSGQSIPEGLGTA